MPEEKVSVCPSCQATDNKPYETEYGVMMRACGRCMIQWVDSPPAADAGLRQPDKIEYRCAHCGELMTQGLSDDTVIHFEWCACVTTPPVPQEAAPRLCTNCKEESWTHCRFHDPAHCHVECAQGTVPPWPTEQYSSAPTAPDSAMRVGLAERKIRQRFGQHGELARIDDILAALIREAGSERERELRDALRTAKELIEPLIETDSDLAPEWDAGAKAFVAEASRLLGGESNG